MKPLIPILAIVALIAATNADFIEFDDRVYKYILKLQGLTRTKADAVNFHIGMDFRPQERTCPWTVGFAPSSSPDLENTPRYPDPDCKDDLGVYFEESGQVFYEITNFAISYQDEMSVPGSIFLYTLSFESGSTPLFVLIVPVFKRPSKVETKSSEELQAWGVKVGVETVGPITEDNLSTFFSGNPLRIEFHWLERLLHFKIYKVSIPDNSGLPEDRLTYMTRPVVISQKMFEMLYKVITSNEVNAGDAGASSSHGGRHLD